MNCGEITDINVRETFDLWRKNKLEGTFYTDTDVAFFLPDFLRFFKDSSSLLIQSLSLISSDFKHVQRYACKNKSTGKLCSSFLMSYSQLRLNKFPL